MITPPHPRSRKQLRLNSLRGTAARHSLPLTHCAVVEAVGFAELRTSLGYEAAHEVMQTLAARLEKTLAVCVLGRIGRTTIELGFAAADDADGLRATLRMMRDALAQPIDAMGVRLVLTIACGVAALPAGRIDDHALDCAAAALAQARPDDELIGISAETGVAAAGNDLDIARALSHALANDLLDLHYQPKLHCRSDRIASVEALLRWTDAEHGAMPVDRVVRITEQIGTIDTLTDWVIERALRDQGKLRAAGHEPTIYINLSGRLLSRRDYVTALIARSEGHNLGYEITETAVIDDPTDAIANVTAMAEAGLRIAIDDYGSGLSSLTYLKQLPAHELKIDRAFICDLITSHRDPLLVRSSIDLAHALDMEVTAEGVDDAMTLSLLRIMGCDIIQGFLISRALPLNQLLTFLDNGAAFEGVGRAAHALPSWPNNVLIQDA